MQIFNYTHAGYKYVQLLIGTNFFQVIEGASEHHWTYFNLEKRFWTGEYLLWYLYFVIYSAVIPVQIFVVDEDRPKNWRRWWVPVAVGLNMLTFELPSSILQSQWILCKLNIFKFFSFKRNEMLHWTNLNSLCS